MSRRENVTADAAVVVVPDWSSFDGIINETVDMARVMMLVLEAGAHAGELDREECDAAVRVANQLVTLTEKVRADFLSFHAAGIFTRNEGVGA